MLLLGRGVLVEGPPAPIRGGLKGVRGSGFVALAAKCETVGWGGGLSAAGGDPPPPLNWRNKSKTPWNSYFLLQI